MKEITDVLQGGWELYNNFQQAHPLIGSMATAECTFLFGDMASQLLKDKKVDSKKLKYTAALAPLYGAGIYALIESGELVGKLISEKPLVKSALGPNLFGNIYNTFFFVNNTVGERTDYDLKKLARHYKNLFSSTENPKKKKRWKNFKENYINNIPKDQFTYSVITTLTAWNAFQSINYAYVPEAMRSPASLAMGFGWLTLLSLWSLKGSRDVVYGK